MRQELITHEWIKENFFDYEKIEFDNGEIWYRFNQRGNISLLDNLKILYAINPILYNTTFYDVLDTTETSFTVYIEPNNDREYYKEFQDYQSDDISIFQSSNYFTISHKNYQHNPYLIIYKTNIHEYYIQPMNKFYYKILKPRKIVNNAKDCSVKCTFSFIAGNLPIKEKIWIDYDSLIEFESNGEYIVIDGINQELTKSTININKYIYEVEHRVASNKLKYVYLKKK